MKRLNIQRGVTLIELLVSMVIGLLIMMGVFQLYLTSTRTQQSQEGVARIQENMRYLFSKLGDDITQTGHFGCIPFQGGSGDERLIEVLLGVGTTTTNNFSMLIDGENGSGPLASDVLRVRYFTAAGQIPIPNPGLASASSDIVVDDTHPRYSFLKKGGIAMVSDCSYADVFMITNDPAGSGGVVKHEVGVSVSGQYNTVNYFQRMYGSETGMSTAYLFAADVSAIEWTVGTSAAGVDAGGTCEAATPQYCALLRNGEELAEGIESFAVEYGWRNGTGSLLLGDADSVPDWNDVDRVRVTLKLNSIQSAPTNDGSNLTTKEVSKVFMLRNQLPGEML